MYNINNRHLEGFVLMETKLVSSRSLATEDAFDGKEFVSIETLLTAFKLNERADWILRSYFSSSYICFVEKRNESVLLRELTEKCLGRDKAWNTPIVTKDGWVYWVASARHRGVLESLAILYSNDDSQDPDFVIRNGIAWQISSLRPNTIMHGRDYVPTREDRKIFELFDVEIIDF
jgi:hypothetical protein